MLALFVCCCYYLFVCKFPCFQAVLDTEDQLRLLTIAAYNLTGNKQPVPGVGIRESTKLDYEPGAALRWATEHKIALSLDKKAFEGIAKTSQLDFVTSRTEIQATIATDLAAVVPTE